jgi:Flagellar biosynthesis protein, FliO
MSTSIPFPQFGFGGAADKAAPETSADRGGSFVSALIASAEKQSHERKRREMMDSLVAEAENDPPAVTARFTVPPPPLPNPLTRAWSWINRKYSTASTKQLRVAETVSLGEKRFVALVQIGGQRFLIGGGPAGVSLLTQLGTDADGDVALQAGNPE